MKQNDTVQMVDLPNGQQAPLLVADLNKNIKMAIISQNVLKFLTKLLPTANVRQIREELRDELASKMTIEELVEVCREFVEFHESVNIIKEFVNADQPTVVGATV